MFRRFMSHVIIALAVVSLTTTFFIWIIDSVVLTPSKLVPALRSGGVPAAIANVLPEKAVQDNKDATAAEKADMKAKIAAVVTPAYVDQKLQNIVETTTTFMRQGKPEPTINLSDFPQKLRDSGVKDVGSDIDKNFAKPINLNEDGKLDKIPQAYSKFKLLKYAGVILFVLLLGLEWLLAEKGKKLQRAGRIFLHAGLWYLLYYVAIIVAPGQVVPKLKNGIKDESVSPLIDSFVKAIQNLFSQYFLGFAISCLVIALVLYIARHGHKHVKSIEDTTAAATAPKKPTTPVKTTAVAAKPKLGK